MKRALSLILALVMCLSLCACNGGNGLNISKGMSMDEMLNSAENFNYRTFEEIAESNKLRAEETYVGNVYKISGFVEKISSNSCTLRMMTDYGSLGGYYIIVPLSREDLRELNTNERITVVGKIGKITTQSIKLTSAYYVSNEFVAQVTILSIVYGSVIDNLPKYATCIYRGSLDNSSAPLCNVELSGEILADLDEDDKITVKGKLVLYDSDDRHMHYGTKILFKIEDAEVVE